MDDILTRHARMLERTAAALHVASQQQASIIAIAQEYGYTGHEPVAQWLSDTMRRMHDTLRLAEVKICGISLDTDIERMCSAIDRGIPRSDRRNAMTEILDRAQRMVADGSESREVIKFIARESGMREV